MFTFRQLPSLKNVSKITEHAWVLTNQVRFIYGTMGDGGDEPHPPGENFITSTIAGLDSANPVAPQDKVRKKFYVKQKFPVLLFPGQGSQFVGMGKQALHYPGVKELYEQVSEHFKKDLLKLCLLGPKEELDKTINSQPAIFVTSLAAVEMMKELHPEV